MQRKEKFKIFAWLENLQTGLVVFALAAMTIVVGMQVFFRFVVKGSLPWSEELARYLMVWAVFIGASLGAREGVHVGVEAFIDLLPKSFKIKAVILSGLISVVFCIIVAYLSFKAITIIMNTGQKSPAIEIPMFWAYLAIPFGVIPMGVSFILSTIDKVNALNEAAK